jgi:hypothetical protein
MKAWIWFRALAVVFALFAFGHTVGTLPRIARAPQEAQVVGAMQQFRFPIMGFTRSYWEFYRGFSIMISIDLAILMLLAWQVATISRRSPREAVPLAMTLVIACAGNAIVSWEYFFTGPIVMSLVAVVCSAVALGLLRRGATVPSGSLAGVRATA